MNPSLIERAGDICGALLYTPHGLSSPLMLKALTAEKSCKLTLTGCYFLKRDREMRAAEQIFRDTVR